MPPQFQQFLHRARRHWTAWSIAEHAGVGLLGGCACAVILLPILLWRGQPGTSVAIILPTLGATAGAIVGFRKRPALADVARLADERFQTADLLATALSLREPNDPWNAIIAQLADSCAAGLAPAQLTPHQLGTRAWSGIALALVLAMTLGMLSITNARDQAQAAAAPPGADAWRAWEDKTIAAPESTQSGSQSAREAKAEQSPDSQSVPAADDVANDQAIAGGADRSTRQSQSETSTGAGSARTKDAHPNTQAEQTDLRADPSMPNGPVANGGGGNEVKAATAGGETAGEVSGTRHEVAPWSASCWRAAQAAANDAIQSGRVPDADRDLVRDYFQNQ